MFDLNTQIEEWRRSVGAYMGDRPDVLDELEGHLREDVEQRIRAGAPPEQAWEQARAQLGDPRMLAAEFAKMGGHAWLPARVAAIAVVALGLCVAAWMFARASQGGVGSLLAVHVAAVTAGYTTVFVAGGLSVWALLARAAGRWDGMRARTLRSAILKLGAASLSLTAIGVVLGALWARDHMGRYWGWDAKEIGGLAVLAACGLSVMAALAGRWRSHRSERADGVLLAGIAGNIVVSLSWFGPPLISRSYHVTSAYGLYLLIFVAIQVVILGAILVGAITRRREKSMTV